MKTFEFTTTCKRLHYVRFEALDLNTAINRALKLADALEIEHQDVSSVVEVQHGKSLYIVLTRQD